MTEPAAKRPCHALARRSPTPLSEGSGVDPVRQRSFDTLIQLALDHQRYSYAAELRLWAQYRELILLSPSRLELLTWMLAAGGDVARRVAAHYLYFGTVYALDALPPLSQLSPGVYYGHLLAHPEAGELPEVYELCHLLVRHLGNRFLLQGCLSARNRTPLHQVMSARGWERLLQYVDPAALLEEFTDDDGRTPLDALLAQPTPQVHEGLQQWLRQIPRWLYLPTGEQWRPEVVAYLQTLSEQERSSWEQLCSQFRPVMPPPATLLRFASSPRARLTPSPAPMIQTTKAQSRPASVETIGLATPPVSASS